jgi:hypothetical protein
MHQQTTENPNVIDFIYVNGKPELLLLPGKVFRYEFSYRDDLYEVKVPSGIKDIGPGAFQHSTNLRLVTLAAPIEKIPFDTFQDCTALMQKNGLRI